MADVFILNRYGLKETYLDLGGWHSPSISTSGADKVVSGPFGLSMAYSLMGDYYTEYVTTTTDPSDKRVINSYGFVERLSDVGSGVYARVVATDPGGSYKQVIDSNNQIIRYADLGDGTYGLVVGGVEFDNAVINEYNLVVGYDSDSGYSKPLFNLGPHLIATLLKPQSELSITGGYVCQLRTNDGGTPTFSASGSVFEVDDVPVEFYAWGVEIETWGHQWEHHGPSGYMPGLVIADAGLLDLEASSMPVTVSASGYPNLIINVPIN